MPSSFTNEFFIHSVGFNQSSKCFVMFLYYTNFKYCITVCLIDAGPNSNYDSYLIFMETNGVQKCRSYHVLSRNSVDYFKTYASEVAELLQKLVYSNQSDVVKVLPFPEECEYRQP